MSGCTSGRRVCTMPGCGKGLITTCRFVRRYRSPQLQEQFPRQCKVGSPDHVKAIVNSSRTGVPLTPLRHVPAAIPLRLENQYFSLDVSHPLATEMLQSGTCMFYVPGMLGEPELELFAVLRT
ncbi:type VI secretion protein [Klebsiella pneumoniae]|uniref:Type VI secretion protein n=1 Tax=Klebsiella pneumoniae TaxID=573 RepID=A0A377TTH4_KLEPN|nr:type VI secretion protein [Klebsiella pneumoniae]